MKKFLRMFIYIFLIVFSVSMYFEYRIYSFGWNTKLVKSDCIIVLGCKVRGTEPTKFLRARLDEGLRLYRDGYGKAIIVSGGQGPGEDISEAEAMKRYLLGRGVPEASIIMEDKSFSTLQNLKNSKSIMETRGFKNAVVVSNKYHLKRASVIAKEAEVEASFSGVFVEDYWIYELSGFVRELPAFIKYYILD